MKTRKITQALEWKQLKETYMIGSVKIDGKLHKFNELQEAVENGEILALLQQCADELHNGDFQSAIRAYRRNLSSQLCNMKKSSTFNHVDKQRYDILNAYTDQFVVTTTSAKVPGKAKVNYNRDDIMSLKGDYEELRKLYNVFADRKSKSPEKIKNMDEFLANFELIKELRKEAKEAQSTVSDDILARLQEGKKLTKAQTEELVKLLTK